MTNILKWQFSNHFTLLSKKESGEMNKIIINNNRRIKSLFPRRPIKSNNSRFPKIKRRKRHN
jgi:hypothetical protein